MPRVKRTDDNAVVKRAGKERIRILFIDEMNSLQSQIAEYFLNRTYGDVYEAYSAGARFDFIDCELISTMYQNGHDIREQRAKDFRSKQMPTKFDYLVFLEKATYDRIGSEVPYNAPRIVYDFGDRSDIKATDDMELFKAYTELMNRVRDWVAETFRSPEDLEGMVV